MAGFMPDEGPEVDLDDLYNAWKMVASLEEQASLVGEQLDATRAAYRYTAMVNRDLWINNKPPTSVYLEKVIPFQGNNDEEAERLSVLLLDYYKIKRELTIAKGYLDILHEKIRIWQTKSANARKVLTVE